MLTREDKGEIEEIVTRVVITLAPKLIDDALSNFAAMVQKGFAGIQEDLSDFREEMYEFREETNSRFDRIENITLRNHEQRIEILEDKTKQLQVSCLRTQS